MNIKSEEKILVALSGGVDSSTTAALLKEANFDVETAIMVFEGVQQEEIDIARSAAQSLKIPFHCFDFSEPYKNIIVDNFIQEYKLGRTPNPCILCNKHIKFDLFLQKAEAMGMSKIATGHYAGIEEKNGRYLLMRGKDRNEQSYFLYQLRQKQLSKILLPLAGYNKKKVRELAHAYNLPTANRKKSQDVCFIPDGNHTAYFKKILQPIPGPIMDKSEKVIGEHKGIFHYTFGQRRGIRISHKSPYYVIKIDAKKNAIYVGEKSDVYKSKLIATDLNFIPFDLLEQRLEVMARHRYISPLAAAILEPLTKDKVKVIFKKPQWALTPGQSVVFYQDEIVLGGGIIEEIS